MALTLVTGGSGYFGSLLTRRLLAEGHRVRSFDCNSASDTPDEVEFFHGDIRDASAIRLACQGVDSVFHCVAQVPLARDKDLFWSVNRDGTAGTLEAARLAGVRKVIYLSSSAVYGVPKDFPIDTATKPVPAEDYGRAKLAAEELCHRYADLGLDVTVIRPRTIMGHGRLGIMQLVFEWVYTGRPVFVLGRGDNLYQFVHADDLAEACLRAAWRSGPATYNIGAAEFGTMRQTLESLVDHAKTGSRVRGLPRHLATFGMRLAGGLSLAPLAPYHWLVYGHSVAFDLSLPMAELDWRPRYSNAAMFAESYDWYVANRDMILTAKGASVHRSPVKEGILWLLRWL